MNYHYLGGTGVKVSEICLGTMTFGNEADETASRGLMDQAFDAGVNFFDTADIYNKGDSESIVGNWMGEKRDKIVLATKTHFPTGSDINDRGSSRRHIIQGVEASLKRLQTDYIDLLYLHHWDANTDLEQTLSTLNDLVTQGKIHYIGVSNFSAWQCAKAAEVARTHGWAPISAIQPMYSLIKRVAEIEILPMAESCNIAAVPYSPLGSGMLTGKYHRNEKGRITQNSMYVARYRNPEYMETAGRFIEYADKKGLHPSALAVKWVAMRPAVPSAIIGCWKPEHLDVALQSQDFDMPDDMRAEISDLSVPPPNATDREDPKHLKITSKDDRK